MLGIIRFFLALCVVATHLSEGHLLFHYWGAFAVFGFYVVSGYLITRVLHETYNFNLLSFAANRFLRLYPVYFFVASITLAAIIFFPASASYHSAWVTSFKIQDILGNILIFPFEFYAAEFRIVPPSWSVAVEIINYFLLWLFVARNKSFATVTLICCVVYHAFSWQQGLPWTDRYFPAYAATLPFSLGTCVYFFKGLISETEDSTVKLAAVSAGLVWLCNLVFCGYVTTLTSKNFPFFYYLNLVSFATMIYFIANTSLNKLFRVAGKRAGDLAYPIFLVHWPIGFAISQILLHGQRRGFNLLAISIPVIIIIAIALAKFGNFFLDPIRSKIRVGAANQNDRVAEVKISNK